MCTRNTLCLAETHTLHTFATHSPIPSLFSPTRFPKKMCSDIIIHHIFVPLNTSQSVLWCRREGGSKSTEIQLHGETAKGAAGNTPRSRRPFFRALVRMSEVCSGTVLRVNSPSNGATPFPPTHLKLPLATVLSKSKRSHVSGRAASVPKASKSLSCCASVKDFFFFLCCKFWTGMYY